MKKSFYYLFLITFLIQSCGTSSNVTSNFTLQKRKYTKGWNVKDLFTRNQNEEKHEAKTQAKEIKAVENDLESTSIRSSKPVEKLTEESIKNEVDEEKIEETKEVNKTTEKFDVVENDHCLTTSPMIEQEKSAEAKETNVDLKEEKDEKKIDYLFRIFFIIGLSIAVLTIILTLLKLTSDIALLFLTILFFLDIISLIIVIISLVKRKRNKGIYKESSAIVVLTELLFGFVSLTALMTWVLIYLA